MQAKHTTKVVYRYEGINRYNEVVLGLLAVVWGAILCAPDDVFAALRRFAPLQNLYPDWYLGVLMITLGVLIVYKFPMEWRRVAHFAMVGIWIFVVTLSVIASPTLPALLISLPFLAFAFLHAGKFWRLSQEIRQTS